MMGMFCPICHALVSPTDARCRSCGAPLDSLVESNQSVLDGVSERPRRAEPEVTEVQGAPYMPYGPRGCQMDIITDMVKALDSGRHFVMESGTGTGKTIVSLAACLDHASRTGKTIVYLTRTISQSDQVMRELRAISRIKPVSGITITGRGKSCPLFRSLKDFDSIPSNVLSMMCNDAREKSRHGKAGGCRYFDRVEMSLPVHILDPDIRDSLMTNLDRPGDPKSLLIIVDEAHNLVDAARESETFRIDRALVDAAVDECSTFSHQPEVGDRILLSEFLGTLKRAIRAAATELIPMGKDTVAIQDDRIERTIMEKFGLSPSELQVAIEDAIDLGEARTDKLLDSGENRVSDIQEVAVALKSWCGADSKRFVRTIHADRAQIEQVLINLLKNACEATGDKLDARVSLSFFRRAGEGDHFVVEDNGPGMRPEVAEQAFIPFFTTKEGGSGIGLSLCRQIVRLHGGHIRMTSAEGKGTQVDFMLPLPPTAATPGRA